MIVLPAGMGEALVVVYGGLGVLLALAVLLKLRRSR